jgi:hypothetical protein
MAKKGPAKKAIAKKRPQPAMTLAAKIKAAGGKKQQQGKQQPRAQAAAAAGSGGGGGANRHTIMLMQGSADKRTRTWSDFGSLNAAVDNFVNSYEAQLRSLNPNANQISYSAQDLHQYIDSMSDLSVMMADPKTKQYVPRGKQFVKQAVLGRLKQAAGGR